MIVWLRVVACVKLSEIWNFLKLKWEGIKGLSQTFIFHSWSPWIQILFTMKPWREDDMTSSIYLNDKGCWKYLNFIWKIFPILKLYATQWFSREKIKWLLQSYEIWVGSLKGSKFKILLKLFSIWSYLGFIQIIFLQK